MTENWMIDWALECLWLVRLESWSSKDFKLLHE